MKKHLLLIIIALMAFSAKAQTAEELFKSAVDKLKAYDNIEIAFDYNMINTEAGIFETMDGAGFLQGDAFKLFIMGQVIICDGHTTWTYNSDAEEVMITEVDKSDGSGSPISIIESYYDNISAKFVDEAGTIKKIEVKSLMSNDNFKKIIITLDSNSLEIKDIHLFDNDETEFGRRACLDLNAEIIEIATSGEGLALYWKGDGPRVLARGGA